MIETIGDIWYARKPEDWVCVTTNGIVKFNGCLVMGKGIALEAAQRYPSLSALLGKRVKLNGLQVEICGLERIIAFPTKHHYRDKSDINLILRSTIQLLDAVHNISEGRILMPRPGCGNGQLQWSEVQPLLAHYLTSDRFVIFQQRAKGAKR